MENSKSKASNTGYKGIFFNKDNGNFEISIAYKRKFNYGNSVEHNIMRKHYLGSYNTLKEAVKAREEFIKSLF